MAAKLKVETQLEDLLKGLQQVQEHAQSIKATFQETGKAAGESIESQSKKTETFLERMKNSGKSVARSLKDDFRSLMGLNALTESMRISNQFRGAIEEVFDLTDSIKKFGQALGIEGQNFGRFQSDLVRGLGRIGLGSDVASKAMKGLMGTGVRGDEQILGYSAAAGQLASVSKSQGSEESLARMMATVLRAQGQDPNNVEAMRALATEVNRGYQTTGKSPEEILRGMEGMFTGMADDFRKRFSLQSMTQLSAAAQVAGPEATTFLEQYMRMSPIRRMALDAQGMGGVIGKDGTLNVDQLQRFAQTIRGRVGNDPQLAAETLGMSEDAAKGFLRLADSLDRVRRAQDDISKSTADLGEDYRNSMGFGEAFRANINRVKSLLSTPLSWISGGGSNLLQKASESDTGAMAVTGGAAVTAALLAGKGLKALGKGMRGGALGGLATGAAVEGLTGREVQPVYVVNAGEIGGGLAAAANGGSGILGKAARVAGLGALGYGTFKAAEAATELQGDAKEKGYMTLKEEGHDKTAEAYRMMMNMHSKFMELNFGIGSSQIQKVEVDVRSRDPGIRATSKGGRGEAQ